MRWVSLTLLASVLLLTGCNRAMENQPRYKTYEEATSWPSGQSARMPVPGTIARGDPLQSAPANIPVALTRELLGRGKKQYETFCTPCHGATGAGDGMVVQRGFPAPPSYHSERLRRVPLKHFYDVISDGYGVMYSYGARVDRSDRWAIAGYIRALQLSQNGKVADLTAEQRVSLDPAPTENASQHKEISP